MKLSDESIIWFVLVRNIGTILWTFSDLSFFAFLIGNEVNVICPCCVFFFKRDDKKKKILFFRRKWPFLAAKWSEKLDFVLKNQEIWKAVFFQAIKWWLFSQTSSEGSGRNKKSVYFTKLEKPYTGNGHKIIYYIQTWPSDVKKLKMDCRTRFWNY